MNRELSANSTLSHYRIVEKLGAGGMGEVWLAEDTRLDRKVALKLLPAEFTRDAERVRRFMQEARTASALNHPNLVTVYDIGESESGRFIVMELVEGRTLRQICQEDNSAERLKSLGAQMAKALGAAHAAGITHRDIKPENIMVREDGYVKILDFGLARLLPAAATDTEAATLARQTMPGQLLGTVAYMSPEQARGEAVGPASDIFSLGIVFYEMATGRHPFQSETLVGYLHAITGQTPAPPSRLKSDIPTALNSLILRMLEKEASRRPAAGEVAQALEGIGRSGEAPKPQPSEGETVMLPATPSGAARTDEGFWVAVLPFKWRGANAELEALAEGLSEEIVTGLSRFSYLRVIARGATLKYAGNSGDVRAIGRELGARYVMEGSLRQAGSTLRVAVQLVDASTGAHLWAETYNRAFSPEAVFEIQDDLVPRIVSTCADHFGVLARSISEAVRGKEIGQLTPYEALMRGFGYHHRLSPAEHALAREALERAVEQAPNNADCWAMLSWIYSHEYGHGFNPRPGSLDRALTAAQRAIDLAPSNHLAYQTLAVAFFFRKDKAACLSAAERALALNPLDASNEAIFLITFTGNWERGCALIEQAMELNPHHPGWYHWVLAVDEYRQRNYRAAVDGAVKANSPGIFWTNMLLAAAYGQLGELEAARNALRNLQSQYEDFAASAREVLGKWFETDLVEHFVDGLRKAGMQFAETGRKIAGAKERTSSTSQPTSPDPSIVVLPFTNTSTDAENDYFCDGLTEELISDLSQIRSLRVISRNSAMRLKGTKKDLKTITEELNVRYVLDGSVRKAGQNFRISVQLIDGISDANLWAEKYSGSLDDIFDIQESVSRSIAEALKIKLTAGEIEQIRERPIADARAYDLYLQAREKLMQGNPAALDRSIELLKQGLEIIGENELLYAALGYSYYFYFKWISKLDENYLRLANECLQKTFAINPASTHGFSLKGFLCYSEGNVPEAVRSLKQAVEIEPTNAEALLWLTIYSQYFENNRAEALKYAEELRRIDPLLPVNTLVRGFVEIYSGDFGAEPLSWIERGFEMDTSAPLSNWLAAIGKAWCGKTLGAIAHADRLTEIAPGWVYTEHALFLKHALRGEKELALRHYTPDFDKEAEYDSHFALHVAHCFALVGEKEKALDFLETSIRKGMLNYSFIGKYDPLLENIRREPRFLSLMTEAKRLAAMINGASADLGFQNELETNEETKTQIPQPPTSAAAEVKNSIAVLPFANISADEENDYFCDGLAEELLNALAKIDELKVAARTSAFSFKGKNAEAREIGKTLNVKTVLEGSVRKAGHRIRINVQLVNASDGYQLWSERYDREMQDIFDVQDEIALAVVDALKVKLLGAEKAAVLKRYTDNAEAYELYLKGRFFADKLSPAGIEKAIDCFNEALSLEPNFTLAYAGLAFSYAVLSQVSAFPVRETMPKAREFAEKALSLDANLADAHVSLGLVLTDYEYDFVAAEAHYATAIKLNPNNASAHHLYGQLLAQLGRHREAEAVLRQAIRLDPLSVLYNWQYGFGLYQARRYDEAMAHLQKVFEMDASFPLTPWLLAAIHQVRGNLAEAAENFAKFYELVGDTEDAARVRGNFAAEGWPGFVRMMTGAQRPADVTGYLAAILHASLGERDAAFAQLGKAYDNREAILGTLITNDPRLDSLREDPRFAGMLRRMGLPERTGKG